MTIELSPALQKRVLREAKARGVKPKQLVEAAVKAYLKPPAKRRLKETDARRQLRELTKKAKIRTTDFDAAVEAAKRSAGKLIEDNADWIEHVTTHGYRKRA
jgi:hypothetical protein